MSESIAKRQEVCLFWHVVEENNTILKMSLTCYTLSGWKFILILLELFVM